MTESQRNMTSKDDERLSALIRDGLRLLEQAESGDEEDDVDYAILVELAIAAFKEATELAPDLPWLWFQIGWLSAVEEASPADLDTARVALERALGLDPYYFTAHLALASVISQSATLDAFDPPMWSDFLGLVEKQTAIERQIVSPNDPVERTRLQGELDAIRTQAQETFLDLSGRWFESNWSGPLGEHICTAVGEDDSHPLWCDMPRSIEGTDITLENYPFATERSFWRFVDLLDELAFFVPFSKKAWYYNAVGLSFETDNWVIFDKRFFEKATQQVTGDPVSLFSCLLYTSPSPRD